jgi:uncharacterized damage-inducible protein DinB
MKDLLFPFASYSAWANQQLLSLLLSLPTEEQQREVASSFNSLQKTVWHIWKAECTWWNRISQVATMETPGEPTDHSMEVLSRGLILQDKAWMNWVEDATDQTLQETLKYSNSKGDSFSQPIYQVVLQVLNHATYHRGQLVTMLREIGVEKIPPTDFILWFRLHK